jgi:hypothetical protein
MSDAIENRPSGDNRIENRPEAIALLRDIEAIAGRLGLPFVESSAQLILDAMERKLL